MKVIVKMVKTNECQEIKEGLITLGVELDNPLLIKAAAYINAQENVRKNQKQRMERQQKYIKELSRTIDFLKGVLEHHDLI